MFCSSSSYKADSVCRAHFAGTPVHLMYSAQRKRNRKTRTKGKTIMHTLCLVVSCFSCFFFFHLFFLFFFLDLSFFLRELKQLKSFVVFSSHCYPPANIDRHRSSLLVVERLQSPFVHEQHIGCVLRYTVYIQYTFEEGKRFQLAERRRYVW